MKNEIDQLTFRIENLSQEVTFTFLKKVDHLFIPKLSSTLNMKDYARKLSEKAISFTVYDGDELISFAVCYFNDQQSQIGYITMLVTMKAYQKQGIASKLIVNLANYGKINNYKQIQLEAYKDLVAFYNKRGFSVISKKLDSSYMMSYRGACNRDLELRA